MTKLLISFLFFASYAVLGQDTLALILSKDSFELKVIDSNCDFSSANIYRYSKEKDKRTISVYDIDSSGTPILRFIVDAYEGDRKDLKHHFEYGLMQKRTWCTSQKLYMLRYGKMHVEFIDDSCEWPIYQTPPNTPIEQWEALLWKRKRL